MNTECRNAQEHLAVGEAASPEVQRHLEGCGECRRFAGDVQAFHTALESTVATPVELRNRTLVRCRAMLDDKAVARETSFRERCRRICTSPRFIVTAATLSVLILVGMEVFQLDDTLDAYTSLLIKIVLIQIAIQNFAAALFMPVLLTLKAGPGRPRPYPAEIGE